MNIQIFGAKKCFDTQKNKVVFYREKNKMPRYAYYYNYKYRRIGHLFQDRYRSETIA